MCIRDRLKVDEEEYSKLDRQYILRTKKESYGYSCLTNQKQYYAENYPQMAIESDSTAYTRILNNLLQNILTHSVASQEIGRAHV